MRIRRYAAGLAAAGLAVLTADCGGSSPASSAAAGNPLAGLSGGQILARAVADLKGSSSVHISGSMANQTTTVDLTVGAHSCTGTIGVKGQGSLRLLGIGNTLWEKPDAQFYRSAGITGAKLPKLAGKYLRTTASGTGFSSLCYLNSLSTQISGGAGHVTVGHTTTILGQPALQLTDAQNSGTAYVTLSAHPQFLQVGSSGSGYVDFTNYNAPLTVTAPPAADTVNAAKYGL